MKKVQEFIGYFFAVAFVMIMVSIVVGIGLIGFETASKYWCELFGTFELPDFILVSSIVFTIVVKIIESLKGRKSK